MKLFKVTVGEFTYVITARFLINKLRYLKTYRQIIISHLNKGNNLLI
jgi:hypothetical protein